MLPRLARSVALALPSALLLLTTAPLVQAQPAGCPPGLAKKNPPCVPPGLAKKGVESGDWERVRDRNDEGEDVYVEIDGRLYKIGERLPDREYIILSERDLARLPRPDDGNIYLRIDNQVVEAVAATGLLVRTLGLWSDLLN